MTLWTPQKNAPQLIYVNAIIAVMVIKIMVNEYIEIEKWTNKLGDGQTIC